MMKDRNLFPLQIANFSNTVFFLPPLIWAESTSYSIENNLWLLRTQPIVPPSCSHPHCMTFAWSNASSFNIKFKNQPFTLRKTSLNLLATFLLKTHHYLPFRIKSKLLTIVARPSESCLPSDLMSCTPLCSLISSLAGLLLFLQLSKPVP